MRALGRLESQKDQPSAVGQIEVVDGLGVFNPNRKLPLHRWYPFVEGFSADLVQQTLQNEIAGAIFDPFGGSGTTALTASLNGRTSFFTEVNPFMAWVADVKVNKVKDFIDGKFESSSIRNFKFPKTLSKAHLESNPFWIINKKRDFMSEENAKHLVSLLHAAEDLVEPLKSIVRLAGATSILPTSNMVRRTDLRRRTSTDKPPLEFTKLIKERLAIFADDLEGLADHSLEYALNLGNDARAEWSAPVPIDLIVTSPPYLNGTNYCRNTKMELFACGFLDSESELQNLRDRSIMAGINNVSSRKIYETTPLKKISQTVKQLREVSYDKRIPNMVNGYFIDMGMMFSATYSNASPNALFLLDIGDSKFADVYIDTPGLLVEVAEANGWRFMNSIKLRNRKSFDGSALSQVLLEFRRMK